MTPGRTRRSLRGLGAVAAIAAIAGCNDMADSSGSPSTDAASQTTSAATPTDDATDASTDPSGTTTRTDASCAERRTELESKIATTNSAIDKQTTELAIHEEEIEWLEQKTGFLDRSYADETIASAQQVGNDVKRSTVFLDTGSGQATGWFIDGTIIATNAHNVAGLSELVGFSITGDKFTCTVVDYVDRMNPDVAILRTDYDGVPLPLGRVDSVTVDQPLVQVGNPGAVGNWVISLGRFVERTQMKTAERTFDDIKSTVPGRKGNSGSPVATLNGRVIGMTYGGGPVIDFQPDARPHPDPPGVYDRMLPELSYAYHVGIDVIEELLEEWT